MVKFSKQFTSATTIALITLGSIAAGKTQAASLYLGLSEYVDNISIPSSEISLENTTITPQIVTRRSTTQPSEIKTNQLPTAEQINQNIDERYLDLIEEDAEQLDLLESQKILKEQGLLEEEKLTDIDTPSVQDMMEEGKAHEQIPKSIVYSLIFLISIWAIPTVNYIGKTFIFGEEGIIDDLQDKFGNPKVPEGTIFLHDRALTELSKLATRAERANSEKFGNEEFLLFIKTKQSVIKGIEEYQKLGHRAELLKVAIAAQSSFLRLEQTELRFRSRSQQEFYQFIADSLSQDLETDKFRDKVKRKLGDIIPVIHTEEGRNALQSYLKEIDIIAKHKLGLKLLSLFKKYQLADFTILKRVSDIVDQLQGHDLLAAKGLVVLVINNYEIFEKLGVIIGVSEQENSPETYANILQYMGLISRHEKSYEKFQQLIKLLKQWEQPYKTITTIRQEYKASEYRLPKEFSQEIPGINIYKKYQKFIEEN